MKLAAQTTFAERAGRTLGRMWRACVRLDRQAHDWLVAQGLAPVAARGVLLILKLVAFGVLIYVALWLAMLIMIAVFAGWTARNAAPGEAEEWAIGDQADHKRSVFYDPINYDDDPDPRFDDER
ncbi:DUF3742 family protein [Azoarcus communis]|uniref:DUF3742 family protein n=3 Tax=Rhodocyclales TaxID=206389 RepID=A0A848G3J4_9RHOO|nr:MULTISPECIES: DUF3742 family protein [Rhodocyclales]NMG49240.1 DUF3742 family protein [Parazoarcus communis]NML25759.1 DUF3742 family protein [Zoogloea dura]TYC61594.1 DUF3742 family protein [Zoogloea oleivorans]SIP93389.1 Protein of unknown function [Aromatoleum tolulyticum]